jgi:Na+/proline symporter
MLAAAILAAGFLFWVKPKNPTPYLLSMRRISGLAVIVGTVAAFWDAAWLLANMPLSVGFGLIPVWQLVVIVGVSVMLLLLVALLWRLTR